MCRRVAKTLLAEAIFIPHGYFITANAWFMRLSVRCDLPGREPGESCRHFISFLTKRLLMRIIYMPGAS